MNLYAVLSRNTHGVGDNNHAWKLAVFDGEEEVTSNLTYDHALGRQISFEDHMRMRLADLGYTASTFELIPKVDGYRIDNVRRVA